MSQLSVVHRGNNFDLIRVVMAVMVLYFHSPILYYGDKNTIRDIFSIATYGQVNMGQIAVSVFFVLSGYLITASWIKTPNILKFTAKRFFRIYPAAIVVIVLMTVLGFFISASQNYFDELNFLKLMRSFVILFVSSDTLNIFNNNPYPLVVNGSMWTLIFELCFYIFIGILGLMKLLTKKIVAVLFLISFCMFALKNAFGLASGSIFLDNIFYLGGYFFGGSVVYFFREKIEFKKKYLFILLIILLILNVTNLIHYLLLFTIIYTTFLIGFGKVIISIPAKIGDLSYGIYIFAFPIQQFYIYYFQKDIGYSSFISLSFLTTAIFAYLSWHLVEKRAIEYGRNNF